MAQSDSSNKKQPQVLIIGSGFAGLNAAKALAKAPVDITLVDCQNHHLFQPLLYQVATAVLSPADIASPIRHIMRKQKNVKVRLAHLIDVDLAHKRVRFARGAFSYDYLVLAVGATNSYFGHDDWQKFAPGLKTIDDALEIRRRVLLAYEEAEWEQDETSRRAKLTFVIVGGGPTGVEMAGSLQEIATRSIPQDFRFIDTTTARVILIEAGERLLQGMSENLGHQAKCDLEEMGVQVRLNSLVTDVRKQEIVIGDEQLQAANIIWAAGVQGSPVATTLGVELDSYGRVKVGPDLSVPGHPEVFAVGDLAHFIDPQTEQPVPGVAPAAIQMGQFAAGIIRREVAATTAIHRPTFSYYDKGSMATIGRNRAVATLKGRDFSGLLAWLAWSIIHIWSLIGFRRRIFVMFSWLWSYLSYNKSARLITGKHEVQLKEPREVMRENAEGS